MRNKFTGWGREGVRRKQIKVGVRIKTGQTLRIRRVIITWNKAGHQIEAFLVVYRMVPNCRQISMDYLSGYATAKRRQVKTNESKQIDMSSARLEKIGTHSFSSLWKSREKRRRGLKLSSQYLFFFYILCCDFEGKIIFGFCFFNFIL